MNPFDLAKLGEEKGKLEEQMGAEGFWEDVENANKVNQRMKVVSAKLEKYDKLARRADDLETLIEMADEENDESLLEEIGAEYDALTEAVEALKLETLLKGPYDAQNAVLSLHAGAGGTEAQDWVSLLYRMYTRYCEKHGFAVKVIDLLDGEEAGIKSVTFEVDGDNAYGYLKAEKACTALCAFRHSILPAGGIRRLRRLMSPPFLTTTAMILRSTRMICVSTLTAPAAQAAKT